jgi:hypothetical protein
MTTLATFRTAPAAPRSRAARWTAIAGAAYVTGWLLGLFTAPSAPSATAPAGAVHAYYLEHGPAILAQSLLVHGIPGIALAVLALSLALATKVPTALRRVVTGSGAAAGAVSLIQVGLAAIAVTGAASNAAATTQGLFHALNIADTVKLVVLAAFAAAATHAARRAGMAPTGLVALAAVLVALLPAGGAAFLIVSPVLTAMLTASLPLLLLWVATLTTVVVRRAR